MKQKILLALILLAIIGLGYYYLIKPTAIVGAPSQVIKEEQTIQETENDKVATTGPTSVEDQVDQEQPKNVELTLALNQSSSLLGIQITPKDLIEDSRCPTDVNCIQAGTVRVRASLTDGESQQERTFVLGQAQNIFGKEIILQSVLPIKISTKQVKTADYRFVFVIK